MPFAAKLNEFMFFSSVRVRSSSEPRRPHGDVDVEAHRALLELRVGDAELDDRLAQELQEALGDVGGVDLGLGDDLDERRAAAVEVDERRGRAVDAARRGDVDVLRRVLLEVRAYDPDLDVAVRASERSAGRRCRAARRTGRSGTPSGCPDRSSSSGGRRRCSAISQPSARPSLIVSSIARRFGTGSAPGSARHTGHVCVFGAPPKPFAAAAEHLRPRLQLHVDLQPDHGLPLSAASTADLLRRSRASASSIEPRTVDDSRAGARARRGARSARARARRPRAAASGPPSEHGPRAVEHARPLAEDALDGRDELGGRVGEPLHRSRSGTSRSRSPARARARPGRACSPRTAARSAAGRPAARRRGRTASRGSAGRPCSTGSSARR